MNLGNVSIRMAQRNCRPLPNRSGGGCSSPPNDGADSVSSSSSFSKPDAATAADVPQEGVYY